MQIIWVLRLEGNIFAFARVLANGAQARVIDALTLEGLQTLIDKLEKEKKTLHANEKRNNAH